jgi:hypothetical protein
MKRSAGCGVCVAGVLAWCLVLVAVPVLAGPQSPRHSKIDPALADAARLGTGDVRVIIRGKDGDSRTAIVASADLEALANDASVDHVSFDAPVRSSARLEDSAGAGRSALLATLGLQGRSLTGRGSPPRSSISRAMRRSLLRTTISATALMSAASLRVVMTAWRPAFG